MPTEIRVNYDWTLNEIRRATQVWERASLTLKITDWSGLILIYAVIVAYAVRQVWHIPDRGVVILALVFPCSMLCLLLGRGMFSRSEPTRCEGSPDLNHPLRYTITDERWLVESATTRNESLWSFIRLIVQEEEGFIIFTHENSVRWLPVDGFESESTIETFRQMLASHGVKYDDRRPSPAQAKTS